MRKMRLLDVNFPAQLACGEKWTNFGQFTHLVLFFALEQKAADNCLFHCQVVKFI